MVVNYTGICFLLRRKGDFMNCKYCNAPLEDGVSVCPCCGKSVQQEADRVEDFEPVEEVQMSVPEESVAQEAAQQAETPEEPVEEGKKPAKEATKKQKVWKTALIAAGCVVAALIVVGAVLYALGVDFGQKGVLSKDSYTVGYEDGIKAADKVVATAGDRNLTNAELQIYYWYGVENFLNYYGSYLNMTGLDTTIPLEEQIYDSETGMTWQQYFVEQALGSWHRYAALNLLAQEEGVEMSQSSQQILETIATQIEQIATMYGFENGLEMLQADWGSACNMDGYVRYTQAYLAGMDYYDVKFEQIQPSDQEIETYFEENQAEFEETGITKDSGKLVDARHILVMPKGGTKGNDGKTTYSQQEWQTCQEEAQKILDQWLEGDANEESFAALAGEYSEDGGSSSNGGLYQDMYVGQMVEPFEDWCFDEARQYGDYGIVQTSHGYHIMFFVESRQIWFTSAKNQMISERTDKFIQDGIERWPVDVDYKKIVISDPYTASESTGETTGE